MPGSKDDSRESMINEEDKTSVDKNNKSNTLKNVKRKIRKTFQRKFNDEEKPKKNDAINRENNDKTDSSIDENVDKGKFTLKKIFRKSSFRKIISNIQQITNFTVSRPFIHSFIRGLHIDVYVYIATTI